MSYLRDYLKYVENNEAHEMYHLWSAFVALASVMGRRVYLDQGQFTVYCNLYIVLLGPPANRKTTGMTVAKKLMREVGGIPFSADAQTKEGLVKNMAANECSYMANGIPKAMCPMTICVTELKEFIGVSTDKMINVVTTLWDADFYDYKTRNKEDINITNPYLCILACETPDWVTLRLKDDVISGGFSRRVLWVYPDEPHKRIAFPTISAAQVDAWNRAVQHCIGLKEVAGQFEWEPEAAAWYKEWYENLKIPQDTALAGYYDSKQTFVLKIAMLIACSELVNPGPHSKLILKKAYCLSALKFLEQLEETLPRVFEGMGRNELNTVSSKIVDLLSISHEPISEKNLRAVCWKFANEIEFGQAMNHLLSAEKVTGWTDKRVNPPRKMFCVKGREPSNVRAELDRAQAASQQVPVPSDVPSSDSASTSGQPSGQSLTHGDLMSLLQQSQQTAPSVSPASTTEPPKGD